jgi:unsaturated rhamnogalacturonyl hydrolase
MDVPRNVVWIRNGTRPAAVTGMAARDIRAMSLTRELRWIGEGFDAPVPCTTVTAFLKMRQVPSSWRFAALCLAGVLIVGCDDARNDIRPTGVAGAGAGATPAAAAGAAAGGVGAPRGGEGGAGGGPTAIAGSAGTTAGASAAGAAGAAGVAGAGGSGLFYPSRAEVIEVLDRVNGQFAEKWPDPAMPLPGSRPSNIWTRGVYYEGLLALHAVAPRADYREFAITWAEHHDWGLRAPVNNADNQCAGQAYIELYRLDGASDRHRIAAIEASIDGLVSGAASASWTWVDAIQMSMPVFAQLGELSGDTKYFSRMHDFYVHTRDKEGGGLYDVEKHLWWRDAKWKPDQQLTPNGKAVYWSRGNGWVFAALARVLQHLPETDAHRAVYVQDFRDMADALLQRQRPDGLWNPSLDDPEHFGGPELTGTALFVYGMAWGVRSGLLDESRFGRPIIDAWNGMLRVSVHPNGFLGFVQSTGDDPSDGQELMYDKQPDFEDYGVGCFLLAGSELAQLGGQ